MSEFRFDWDGLKIWVINTYERKSGNVMGRYRVVFFFVGRVWLVREFLVAGMLLL